MRIENPLTQEQLKIGDTIPPGTYPFEVIDAQDTFSKSSGNEMITLNLRIFLEDGRIKNLNDYLLESMAYKMGHFFEAAGLYDKYCAGDVDASDCIGKCGELKIVIQKDKKGVYPDRPGVSDYILTDEQTAKKVERKVAESKKTDDFGDQDLPF